jgi:hypothetical protein
MDIEFLDRVWDRKKLESLLFGRCIPDSDSDDGWVDVPLQSWYQLRCRAYDRGDVNAVHDAIQFESAIQNVDDPQERAAVMLAVMGWDFADIGAALRGRRTGRQLVRAGVRAMVTAERRRGELREG